MNAVSKARSIWNDRQQASRVPNVFKPGPSGGGYYGQWARYGLALH